MDFKWLLDNIDTVISVFVPASAFMIGYAFVAHYSTKPKIFSAETVVCSYLITTGIAHFWPWANTFYIVFGCFLVGILAGVLKNCVWFEAAYKKVFHKVYNDNVWYGISDYKHGCYVHVFLDGPEISYRGMLRDDYTDTLGNTWIVLSNYIMYRNYDGGECCAIENFTKDDTREIALNTAKINRASIHYSQKSHKIK